MHRPQSSCRARALGEEGASLRRSTRRVRLVGLPSGGTLQSRTARRKSIRAFALTRLVARATTSPRRDLATCAETTRFLFSAVPSFVTKPSLVRRSGCHPTRSPLEQDAAELVLLAGLQDGEHLVAGLELRRADCDLGLAVPHHGDQPRALGERQPLHLLPGRG